MACVRVKQFRDLFAAQFAEVGPAEISGPDSVSKTDLFYKVARPVPLLSEPEMPCSSSSVYDCLTPAPVRRVFVQDSESTFVMYASGRRHVRSCLVTLQLRKRHDVFWTSVDYLYPTDDCVTIEAVLNAEDVDPFVLAVVRKKDYRHVYSQVRRSSCTYPLLSHSLVAAN